jgi:hypothetical protein
LGITINALAIVGTNSDATSPPGLANYYGDNVIGGAGAFVETAASYSAFERAMRRKLLREIGGPLIF